MLRPEALGQVQCWQTVQRFEIRFFTKRQKVRPNATRRNYIVEQKKKMKQIFDRTNPDEADEYFMDCIREGNLKNAMTCFDKEAVYMDKNGNAISGLANIEKVVAALCTMKPDIKIHKHKNSPVGNDLLYRLDKWTMTATGPQGDLIKMQGASAHIMRKNADGIWLWLVDNPFAASFFAD